MTISSTNRKAGPFIGNGSASVFAFSFRVFAASDLEVVRITVATGVETTLTINSAYTVSLNADQNNNPGGSITLTGGALASGYNLILTSDIANLQPTDLTNQGGFYPEVITGALDRATIQIQQLDEHVARTLSYPITDPWIGAELPAVAQRKGTVLLFDEVTGEPVAGPNIAAVQNAEANAISASTSATNAAASAVSASSSAASSAASSASAGAASGRLEIATFSQLATVFGYSTAGGRREVAAGDLIHVVDIDATYLVLATGDSAFDFNYTGTGGVKLDVMLDASRYSVRAFGAVGDGTTDDTAAFQAAYTALATSRINARGIGQIYVPRGRYLCNGTITMTSSLGVKVVGNGPEASQIIRTVDTGNLFSIGTYIYVEFSDLSIYHITSSDRSTWTTNCFQISGVGGGREFCLRRVETTNFNRIVSFIGPGGNEDTNYFEGLTCRNFKTFLYTRNSQSVVNKAVQCTWDGYVDSVFDMAGFGHLHVDTANVVQSGTFLRVSNLSTGNPTAQYLMTNVKFEWWNGPNNNNTLGTTKILEITDNVFSTAYVKFVNCGISGGTPDTSIYSWDLQGGGYTIEVDNGQWGGTTIRTKARTAKGNFNSWWVKFINCISAPSQTINRIAGSAGAHHVPVVFNACFDVANILLRGPDGSTGNGKVAGIALDRNLNTKNNNGSLVSGNATTTFSFPCYGQLVLVEKIRVVATIGSGWAGQEIKAFADSALTTQIGATLTPTETTWSSPTAYVYDITVPAGTFTSEGVYVTVKNTNVNGGVQGLVYVDTLSV